MKPNQYIFEKMSKLLKEELQHDVLEYDEGTHLVLGETGLWISTDDKELTIGFGMNHTHHSFDSNNMEDAIDSFFLLLTRRKKITDHAKGTRIFKTKVEIELENEESLDLGTTITFPLQFWKRTQSKIAYRNAFINEELISKQWKELIDYTQEL